MYDEKSDIWALGCILYEMACLQKTFEVMLVNLLYFNIEKEYLRGKGEMSSELYGTFHRQACLGPYNLFHCTVFSS